MGLSTGLKNKLRIAPCVLKENGDISTVRDSAAFELMLNPSKYKHEKSVGFGEDCTVGKIGSESKFKGIEPESVSFDFVLDGTGVVNTPIPGFGSKDVTKQLKDLSDVIYGYNGENHEPNVVQLLWGKMLFFGRLKTMNTVYTLFKPSGAPLRATVSLAFRSYISPKEEALRKRKSSPDLSHKVVFRKGDTLPLLCYQIYKDSAYYPEVASFNNLVDFRNIEPGTEIAFPPLR